MARNGYAIWKTLLFLLQLTIVFSVINIIYLSLKY